ncbi:unnamed protein product, partial [Amoebophrya sp. A25]
LDPKLGEFLRAILGLTEVNELGDQASTVYAIRGGKIRNRNSNEVSDEQEDTMGNGNGGGQGQTGKPEALPSTFDLIYSYGVLHHTGDLSLALQHAIPLTKVEGGRCFVALYNQRLWPHARDRDWLDIKEEYLGSRPWRKQLLELSYLLTDVFKQLRSEIDRFDSVGAKLGRGMSVPSALADSWVPQDLERVLTRQHKQVPDIMLGDNKGRHLFPNFEVEVEKDKEDSLGEDETTERSSTSTTSSPRTTTKQEHERLVAFDEMPDRFQQKFMRDFLYQKFNSGALGRGMSYLIEVRDNLGGYPVEYSHGAHLTELLRRMCSSCKVVKMDDVATTGYLITLTALDVEPRDVMRDDETENPVLVPVRFGGKSSDLHFQDDDYYEGENVGEGDVEGENGAPAKRRSLTPEEEEARSKRQEIRKKLTVFPGSPDTIFTGCYGLSRTKADRSEADLAQFTQGGVRVEYENKNFRTRRRHSTTASPDATASTSRSTTPLGVVPLSTCSATENSRSCYGLWRLRRAVTLPGQSVLPLELFLEAQSEPLVGAKSFLRTAQRAVGRELALWALESLLSSEDEDTSLTSQDTSLSEGEGLKKHQEDTTGGSVTTPRAIDVARSRRFRPLLVENEKSRTSFEKSGLEVDDSVEEATSGGGFRNRNLFLRLYSMLAGRHFDSSTDKAPTSTSPSSKITAEEEEEEEEENQNAILSLSSLSPARFDLTFLAEAIQMYYSESVALSFDQTARRAAGERARKYYQKRLMGINPFFQASAAFSPVAENIVQHLSVHYKTQSKGSSAYQRPSRLEMEAHVKSFFDGGGGGGGGDAKSDSV